MASKEKKLGYSIRTDFGLLTFLFDVDNWILTVKGRRFPVSFLHDCRSDEVSISIYSKSEDKVVVKVEIEYGCFWGIVSEKGKILFPFTYGDREDAFLFSDKQVIVPGDNVIRDYAGDILFPIKNRDHRVLLACSKYNLHVVRDVDAADYYILTPDFTFIPIEDRSILCSAICGPLNFEVVDPDHIRVIVDSGSEYRRGSSYLMSNKGERIIGPSKFCGVDSQLGILFSVQEGSCLIYNGEGKYLYEVAMSDHQYGDYCDQLAIYAHNGCIIVSRRLPEAPYCHKKGHECNEYYGLIDDHLNQLLPLMFHSIKEVDSHSGVFVLRIGDKFGLFFAANKRFVPVAFDHVQIIGYEKKEILCTSVIPERKVGQYVIPSKTLQRRFDNQGSDIYSQPPTLPADSGD